MFLSDNRSHPSVTNWIKPNQKRKTIPLFWKNSHLLSLFVFISVFPFIYCVPFEPKQIVPRSRNSINLRSEPSYPYGEEAICLSNFDVSDGSIIRTKDSQAQGATYLNETEIGAKSRDECLRLCCHMERCNVAVFEEKVNYHMI